MENEKMKILVPNNVDKIIVDIMEQKGYDVKYDPSIKREDIPKAAEGYDAIFVRSVDLNGLELPDSVKAVARAGAGVNNIPYEELKKKGVVVFNTPGQNADSVAELTMTLAGMVSRNLEEAIKWTRNLDPNHEKSIAKRAEEGKKAFKGFELGGKKISVIGLGYIGRKVANKVNANNMITYGYDPIINDENSLNLSKSVKLYDNIDEAFIDKKFISLHVNYSKSGTHHLIDERKLELMSEGTVLMNFAREKVVDEEVLLKYLDKGIIGTYVTDFHNEKLVDHPNIIPLPHLGASTIEAEANCAITGANLIDSFLRYGNIEDSVNFPGIYLEKNGKQRISVLHSNSPGIIGKVSDVFGKYKINISSMADKGRDDVSVYIGDVDTKITDDAVRDIKNLEGIIKVRVI